VYYFLFTVQYDGTDFCGWVKQKNQVTIQGEIEKAITLVAKNSYFKLIGASKTDAGVHALNQKVWVALNFNPNISGFLRAINKILPISIRIMEMKVIKKEFKVRDCVKKTYHYQINLETEGILKNRFYFQPNYLIDVKKLKKVTKLFLGMHDFINFSGLKKADLKIIESKREITAINLKVKNKVLIIEFIAKSFIRYQIRMIVGALLAYNLNKITIQNIKDALECKRTKLPYIANSKGLTLFSIEY